MNVSEAVEQSIEKWETNIEQLEKLNWMLWSTLSPEERMNQSIHNHDIPSIFGYDCALCQWQREETERREEWVQCPLYPFSDEDRSNVRCEEDEDEDGCSVCCYEWARVYDCFIQAPEQYTKAGAERLFEDMLERLKMEAEV